MRKMFHLGRGLLAAVLLAVPTTVALGDDGAQHQIRRTRPIELGVSGINREDFCFVRGGNFVVCSTGTLGSLVEDGATTQYILSNNHVLGIINDGTAGDDVIQPGYLDDCFNQDPSGNVVADLTEFVPLDFSGGDNLVDAAIAEIRAGEVRTDGFILDIGTIGTSTLDATVGLGVKKSGRTTGLTTGTVDAINVSVNVGYEPCGGSGQPDFVGHFVDQIVVTPGSFSDGGDSGSLIVENVGSNPRAVGLLFAGSSSSTIGNRIQNVLCEFSQPLAMAGGTSDCAGGCTTDADCTGSQICCNGSCVTAACSADADCDDGDPCTVDTCNNAGTCSASCSNTEPACGLSDGCCPTGCDSSQDPDCPAGQCGDGVCGGVPEGEDCFTCPADCRCAGPGCAACCGNGTCDGRGESANNCPVDCAGGAAGSEIAPLRPNVTIPQVATIKARHSNALFAIPDVVGHGIGLDDDGKPMIEVYLSKENGNARGQIPAMIEGVRTVVKVTGPFEAYGCIPAEIAEKYREQE